MLNERIKKKSEAIIVIYKILITGGVINKKQMSEKIGVSTKTIERYIDDINMTFEAEEDLVSAGMRVEYDYERKGYALKYQEFKQITKKDVLAISKVLLESRGFTKKELDQLLFKLISNCCYSDQVQVKDVIFSEKNSYIEPRHSDVALIDKVWDLSEAIRTQRKLEIEYTKIANGGVVDTTPLQRKLLPLGLMFSEYYFYLLAYIESKGRDIVIPYRLDRIRNYEVLEERFNIDYNNKFEEGELRKHIQFMKSGEFNRIKFKFKGASIEAVLDRIPTAKVVSEKDGEFIVQASVIGDGVKMWLLSQGDNVEVLEPEELRADMKKTVENMMRGYM